MDILITGAGGFVGRTLVRSLIEKNPLNRYFAFLLPNEEEPMLWSNKVTIIRGDLRDRKAVFAAVAGKNMVFHLAAYISYWKLDLKRMQEINRDAVSFLVEACLMAKVQRLVHISSVGAIGFKKDGTETQESEAFNWPEDFGYMTTKRDGQKIVLDAVNTRGLDAVIVNPASIMGPGDPTINSAHNRLYSDMYRRPFFFGTFAGGLAIVDVRDLVSVIIAAAEKGRKGECYLAVGANVPYRRVLEIMAKKAKKPFIPFAVPPFLLTSAGYLMESISLLTRKRPLLTTAYGRLSGWTAYYSNAKSIQELGVSYRPLEETIGDACTWFENTMLKANHGSDTIFLSPEKRPK
jgi:dihydroflavonol-4-reductase